MRSKVAVKKTVPKGWIDIQVNGYMGINFSSPQLSLDDLRSVTSELAERGTGAYCPTLCTSELEVYDRNLPLIASAMEDPEMGPHILGIHIEGPFFSKDARGAHKLSLLRPPDIKLFERWQKLAKGRIRILTLAPELEGAEALIRFASSRNVVVSLGHHMGDRDSIKRAVAAGARCCTHIGNGIPNMLQRHPNPIWTQLAEDRLMGLFITDGHHLPEDFVKVALRAKGIERSIVTSDSSHLGGLPPGEYPGISGVPTVVEPSGRISIKDGWSLAGSHATMEECMNWLSSLGMLSRADILRLGRKNPLKLLGIAV